MKSSENDFIQKSIKEKFIMPKKIDKNEDHFRKILNLMAVSKLYFKYWYQKTIVGLLNSACSELRENVV